MSKRQVCTFISFLFILTLLEFSAFALISTPEISDYNYVSENVKPVVQYPNQAQLDNLTFLNETESYDLANEEKYKVLWSSSTGNPLSISVFSPSINEKIPEEIAYDFLSKVYPLYQSSSEDMFSGLKFDSKETKVYSEPVDLKNPQEIKIKFRQFYNGVPVEKGLITLYMFEGEDVFLMNGNYYSNIDIDTNPLITSEEAVKVCLDNLNSMGKNNDVKVLDKKLVVYPLLGNYFLAYKVIVTTEEVSFKYFVDAKTGEILSRKDLNNWATGTGKVYVKHPRHDENNDYIQHPESMHLTSYQSLYNLEENGLGNCAGYLRGDFIDADNYIGADAYKVNCYFDYSDTNQHFDEVMAYYHGDTFHNWLVGSLSANPNDPLLDYQIPIKVHHTLMLCNARYAPLSDQIQMGDYFPSATFCEQTGPCYDTAKEESVIYHEYMHSMIHHMLNLAESGDDFPFGLHEGLADYFAESFTNDSFQGEYFRGNNFYNNADGIGCAPRNADNTWIYPDSIISDQTESHKVGHVYSGVLWDFRKEFISEQMESTIPDQLIFRHIYYVTLNQSEDTTDEVMDTLEDSLNAMLTSANNNNQKEHKNRIKASFIKHNIALSLTGRLAIINAEIYYSRNASSPPFHIWGGTQNRYKVQVATNTSLFTNPNLRTSSNWYESSVMTIPEGEFWEGFTYSLPTSIWNVLKNANKLYYRVITYLNIPPLAFATYSTSDSDLNSMPYININTTGVAP